MYPRVHLSHISGHFQSNTLFLCISGHFRSIFGRISRQMHYSRASQCIFVQYGKHIRRIFWKYIYGEFFRISIGGSLCLRMQQSVGDFGKYLYGDFFQNSVRGKIDHKVGGGYDIGGLPEGDVVWGDIMGGVPHRVSPGSE